LITEHRPHKGACPFLIFCLHVCAMLQQQLHARHMTLLCSCQESSLPHVISLVNLCTPLQQQLDSW
jgi:hypothetical protein